MPRYLLLASLLIACGSPRSPSHPNPSSSTPSPPLSSAAPPPAHEPLSLLHAVVTCADERGGWSGFTVFEVVEGPGWKPGRQVIAYYGEAAQLETIRGNGAWLVGSVTLGAITPATGWPNQCQSISSPAYDGFVVAATGFANEADARRALQ